MKSNGFFLIFIYRKRKRYFFLLWIFFTVGGNGNRPGGVDRGAPPDGFSFVHPHRLNAASVGATLNVPPAPIASPPAGRGSPTDSLRRYVAAAGRTGCNGTTAAAGAASRLVNAAVSSIDDTLNEVPAAIRKKYPFELEKAIHNVKFIQHHLQRQDEYNTVIP